MTDTSNDAVARLRLDMINSGNTTTANMLNALADERDRLATAHKQLMQSLDAANARADHARDKALVDAKAAVGLVRVPVGSTGPIWDAMDAIDALRDKPAPAQCCMCGKTDLSTVEGDGGPECQLDDGRWTCSHACYDRATEEPAPAVTVREAARVLLDQPYDVMSVAFDAIEKLHGEGADRIMAAALRAIAGGGDE